MHYVLPLLPRCSLFVCFLNQWDRNRSNQSGPQNKKTNASNHPSDTNLQKDDDATEKTDKKKSQFKSEDKEKKKKKDDELDRILSKFQRFVPEGRLTLVQLD